MKRLNGTIVQNVVNVKSIAITVLVWITFLSVSCNEKSTVAKTDVGGKGREIVYFAPASIYVLADVGGKGIKSNLFEVVKADVGGGKSDSTIRKNQALVVHDVGGKNQNTIKNSPFESEVKVFMFSDVGGGRSSTSTLQIASIGDDVGGGKTVSTTKNAVTDVGGRGTTLTGNLFVVFQSRSDVGGTRDVKSIKKQVVTLYFDVGGKGTKNLRGVVPKTAFS